MGNLTLLLVALCLLGCSSALFPISASFPRFTGRFELVSSENFDEYMSAVGVGTILAALASHASPVTEISEFAGDWGIKTTTAFTSTDIKFRLGVPFEEKTADGRKCQSTIVLVEDTLVHKQFCDGKDYEILRKFSIDGKEMVMTLTAPADPKPVVARRVYKRIED